MKRVSKMDDSYGPPSHGILWLRVADAIRLSHVEVYGLQAATSLPAKIGTVTFDGPVSSDTLVGVEIQYGHFDDSESPRASITTVWRRALGTSWKEDGMRWSRTVGTLLDYEDVRLDPEFRGIEIDYGNVNLKAQGSGESDDWSGSLQIDDSREGTRICIKVSHWTEGGVHLTLANDIEPLLQQQWDFINRGESYHIGTTPHRTV